MAETGKHIPKAAAVVQRGETGEAKPVTARGDARKGQEFKSRLPLSYHEGDFHDRRPRDWRDADDIA